MITVLSNFWIYLLGDYYFILCAVSISAGDISIVMTFWERGFMRKRFRQTLEPLTTGSLRLSSSSPRTRPGNIRRGICVPHTRRVG